MITRDQLLEAIVEHLRGIEELPGNFDLNPETELELEGWAEEFDADTWQAIFEDLGVPDEAERIEWYNATGFGLETAELLANVQFQVLTCYACKEKGYEAQPESWRDFQGVNDPMYLYGIGTVEISIGGASGESILCGKCIEEMKTQYLETEYKQ